LSRCLLMVGLCRHCRLGGIHSLPYERKLINQAQADDAGTSAIATAHRNTSPYSYERDKMRP
jgi:hypothetical protein